ncbi:MAG: lipopolysaccharide biosynthesis protein RfbH, partial [Clostridia bacterium]|nr:lipopolysaccharide biosynthesis protein RfbH [Clostridia bacterium]
MDTKQQILQLTKQYYEETFATKKDVPFQEGDRVTYAARVFDEEELLNLIDSSLEFWLTSGRYTDAFEKGLAEYLNVPYCLLVNSGSSANLLAFMTLTSPLLKERAIKRGDEVITVACGFPTTVAPIMQYGAVPVFVDVEIPSYNIDPSLLERAYSPKTKAVMIAHTLGNPFPIKEVKEFCDKHGLWLIEDNCDALGSTYTIDGETRFTGTWGDIGTSSFYPPHHMTMGEGGAVYTRNPLLKKIAQSMRDWGRDCVCPSGMDNKCGHRYDGQYGELPKGYDHKYVYSHLGYNLKATDLQASVGCAQLKKFPSFVQKRKENWAYLKQLLSPVAGQIILPQAETNSDPSWFGFLMTFADNATRDGVAKLLEDHNVQTRMLFSGNII